MKTTNSTQICQAKMTLFFTANLGLKTWAEVGNLDRELALYQRLSSELAGINFVAYEGKEDHLYSKKLGNIELLSTKWYRRTLQTSLQLFIKHYRQLNNSDIFKTNQILGAEIPIMLNRFFKKKLIVRCGFLKSYFVQQKIKNNHITESDTHTLLDNVIKQENHVFASADIGVVSTAWQRDLVINRLNISPNKIKVIPNYVVTDIFKPNPQLSKKYDLVFVGRSAPQKNITNLLEALNYLKKNKKEISLVLVGSCCNDVEVKEKINKYGLTAIFKGNIPNFELPNILNQSKVFVIPSYYEGHPKTLLEAMSCGLPIIGTDTIGIKNDIRHRETGYLCKPDYLSIAKAIEAILPDKSLLKILGKNAREYILQNYSLDKITELELSVIQEVLSK